MKRRTFLSATAALLGAGVSPVVLRAVQAAEASDTGAAATRVLTQDQHGMLEALVERVIPATDTPGALEVGVADYIDFILVEGFDQPQQLAFLSGLHAVEQQSMGLFDKSYVDLEPDQQDSILAELERAGLESKQQGEGEAGFFQILKELTLIGYYTSRIGATQELSYRPVPGLHEACHEMGENERARFYGMPFEG